MANPSTLQIDTVLYHPAEPEGRKFPAGSPWPGDAWDVQPGGGRSETSMPGMAKDLIAANDRADALGAQIAQAAHDRGVLASERDAANGKVAELEQRAIAAEQAQKAAEESAVNYMRERDQARSDHQRVSEQLTEANAKVGDSDPEKVADLVKQLGERDQTIADLNDKLASKPAPPAAVDATKQPKGKPGPKPKGPQAAQPGPQGDQPVPLQVEGQAEEEARHAEDGPKPAVGT